LTDKEESMERAARALTPLKRTGEIFGAIPVKVLEAVSGCSKRPLNRQSMKG